jgi:hypothetical protein
VDEVLIKGLSGPGELLDALQRLLPHFRIKPRREQILPVPLSRTS